MLLVELGAVLGLYRGVCVRALPWNMSWVRGLLSAVGSWSDGCCGAEGLLGFWWLWSS